MSGRARNYNQRMCQLLPIALNAMKPPEMSSIEGCEIALEYSCFLEYLARRKGRAAPSLRCRTVIGVLSAGLKACRVPL